MKITKEDVAEIMGYLDEAETFRPLIIKALEILKSFSGEISDIPQVLIKWQREKRVETIKYYISQGFDKDDAILMTLDTDARIEKSIKNAKKVSSKGA